MTLPSPQNCLPQITQVFSSKGAGEPNHLNCWQGASLPGCQRGARSTPGTRTDSLRPVVSVELLQFARLGATWVQELAPPLIHFWSSGCPLFSWSLIQRTSLACHDLYTGQQIVFRPVLGTEKTCKMLSIVTVIIFIILSISSLRLY